MAVTLPLAVTNLPADAVEVGRIIGPWGVKGWFKLLSHSADAASLLRAQQWFLQPSEKGAKTFTGTLELPVRQARVHSDSLVACSDAIADRNLAEALKGARIFVARTDFPKTEDGEFYWVDLIGLAVVNREGVELGQVKDLMSTGPQTVLVIEQEGAQDKPVERMIPFVDAFVDQVDLAQKRITVDWQPDY